MNLNPSKGFGKPGSLQWHTLHIKQCETKEEVQKYLKDTFDYSFSLPLSLLRIKDVAVKIIEGLINNG